MGDEGAPPPRPIYARLERARNAPPPQDRTRGSLPVGPPPPLRRNRWPEAPHPHAAPPAPAPAPAPSSYGSRGPRPPPPPFARAESRGGHRESGPPPLHARLRGPPPPPPPPPPPVHPKAPARTHMMPSAQGGSSRLPPPPPSTTGIPPLPSHTKSTLPGPSHSAPMPYTRQHGQFAMDARVHRGDAGMKKEEEEEEEGQLGTRGDLGLQVKAEPRHADLEDLRSMLSPTLEPSKRKHLGWGQGLAKLQTNTPTSCAPKGETENASHPQHLQIKIDEDTAPTRVSFQQSSGVTSSNPVQAMHERPQSFQDTTRGLGEDRMPRNHNSTSDASVAVCIKGSLEQQESTLQDHSTRQQDLQATVKPKQAAGLSLHPQMARSTSKQMMTEKEIQLKALQEQQQSKKSIMTQIDDVDQQIQKVETEVSELSSAEKELDQQICDLTEKYAKESMPPKQKVLVLFESKEDAAVARRQLVERVWMANAEKAAKACRDIGLPVTDEAPTTNGGAKLEAGRSSALWRVKREEIPDVQCCSLFEQNALRHEQLRPLFLQILLEEREKLVDQRLMLGLTYRKKWKQWQLRLAGLKAKKEAIDANRPIWDQRRTSSRLGGSTSSFSGIVRSEYEEMQVIAQLQKSEELKHLVKTPDMIINERKKEICNFPSNNGLIRDPLKERENELRSRPWEEDEIKIFKEKYLLHTKDFRKIATFLPGRTSQDCVMFYYRNQKSEEFAHVRRKQQLKKRRLYSEAKKLSGTYMDVTANTGKVKVPGEKQPPAANRSSGTAGPSLDGKPKKERNKGKREGGKADGWHAQELESFLKAIKTHGKDFKAIAAEMGTRSASAIRTFWALNKKSMSLEKLAAESEKSKELVDKGKPKSVVALLKARGGLSSLPASKDWSKQDRDAFLKAFKLNGACALDIAKALSSKTEDEVQACLEDIHELVHSQPPKVSEVTKRTVSHWSQKEKEDFHAFYQLHGHDWKTISGMIQTKSPVQVKNYFQSYKQKHGEDSKKKETPDSPPPAKRLAEEPQVEPVPPKKPRRDESNSLQEPYVPNHDAVLSAPERVQSASPSVNPETLAALYAGAQNPYLTQLAFTQQGSMPRLQLSHSFPLPSSSSWSVGGAQMSAFSPVSGGIPAQQDCESKGPEQSDGVQVFGKTILPDSPKPTELQPSRGVFGQTEAGWHTGPMMPPEAAAAFSSMDPSLIAILQAAAAAQVAQFGGMNYFMPGAASGPSNAPALPPDESNALDDGAGPSTMEE